MFAREHADAWTTLASAAECDNAAAVLSTDARAVLDRLAARGALFAHEIAAGCGLAPEPVRHALAELVAAGLIASDGFSGLRGLIGEQAGAPREMSGRWYPCSGRSSDRPITTEPDGRSDPIETQARVMLHRYGVVCRRVLAREPNAQPWRVLARVYRTLEARGELRGGRFVSGVAGEQFALPEAVERLRELRRTPPDDRVLVISAADPLNLAGIVTAGERIAAIAATRIAYRNGTPLAALEGDYIRPMAELDRAMAADVASALTGRRMPPIVSGFVGRVS
jgi:ATP-dependent Lhr-like helicase